MPVDFEAAARFIHTNARLLDRHQSAAPRRLYKRGESGYDARRSGFNVAIEHHPALVVEAFSPPDVIAAVRLAAADCRPVAVMNTGHGPSLPADGAVLIRMGQINRVDVDPIRRRVRIQSGAPWRAVIDAAAPYGLAPLNGSSPDVGAVGYTLGGGVGLLARRFGFAADHVRWFDLVTADGRLREVSADSSVAYSGDEHAEGFGLVEPLRRIGPRLADTVRLMPYTAVGTIHHDLTDVPVPAFDRNILLGELDRRAASVLSRYAGPRNRPPFLTELRAWGRALSRRPIIPNAIGGRHATFSRLTISDSAPENRGRRDELLEAMRPWSTGMTYPNFNWVEDTSVDAVRRSYRPEDFTRLQRIKATYDPRNLFRVNFNITPEGSPE